MYFRLHRVGSFEFGNCTIYNNIALKYGGGVFIDTLGQVASSVIIALYIAILLSMLEEECTLTYMKELVELSIVTALYTIIMLKMMEEECILISMKEEVELSLVTVEYSKILHTSDRTVFVLFMLL